MESTHTHTHTHTKFVSARTQEKGAITLQETELNLLVSVQEALVEAWVKSGLPRGQEH